MNSVGEEKESGRLMNGRYSYSKCVVLDETAYEDMVKPTFVHFYGNYPEQTDEIMMSKKTLDYLGISSPKIGMKITLDFYWNDIFTTKMTGKQEFVYLDIMIVIIMNYPIVQSHIFARIE